MFTVNTSLPLTFLRTSEAKAFQGRRLVGVYLFPRSFVIFFCTPSRANRAVARIFLLQRRGKLQAEVRSPPGRE